MGGWQVGVDVGGTFTDVVAADLASAEVLVAKVPSTPADQAEAAISGLARLGIAAADVARFVHGTTVATNAVLERRGARTVLVTTEGFRDLLEIGRQTRPKLYDLFADRPPPLVPRELVVEVPERVTADGEVLVPLTSTEAVVAAVASRRPEAVAICLLFSFLRPEHETALAAAIAAALPGVAISRSSEVLPVFREFERASTTALNAYVAPPMGRYLGSLQSRLREDGLPGSVQVMRSGGGTFDARQAAASPVQTLLSGPAAGAWGAALVGRAAGLDRLIAFDMGGTSTDVTLIEDGVPGRTAHGSVGGLPFGVPTTDIHTIGAGGGSVAWRDAGGALRVGPRSAGATPGPAAYGLGGTEPTMTDAAVALGHLADGALLGGTVRLRRDLALAALEPLAGSLGLDAIACAQGILRVATAQITKALRVVSVERGKDPRGFALLAFGGAGPLLQGPLARALGSPAIVVPRHPGVLSALGLLTAPVAVDVARTSIGPLRDTSGDELERRWRELEARATAVLHAQGAEVARLARTADLRYAGQAFELEVAAAAADTAAVAGAFHALHRERYGYEQRDEPVELVTLRVRAEAPPSAFEPAGADPGGGARSAERGRRELVLAGEPVSAPVYDRDALGAGDRIAGPAALDGIDSTCVLLPGQRAEVDAVGSLIVREA